MHKMLDTQGFELTGRTLAGRYPKQEFKDAVTGKIYIVKYADGGQSRHAIPYHVSEYLSSGILNSIGVKSQVVHLSTIEGVEVCAIEKFAEELITFTALGESTLSGNNLNYDLDVLGELIAERKYEGDFYDYLWDTFLADAFVNNLDRHPNNWGFFRRDGLYVQSPLIDNASSLYSINASSLNKMYDLEKYIKKFGMSQVKYMGEKRSFENIITTETSVKFRKRLENFVGNMKNLDYSYLDFVSSVWPVYEPYIAFVRRFIERQVAWFEKI